MNHFRRTLIVASLLALAGCATGPASPTGAAGPTGPAGTSAPVAASTSASPAVAPDGAYNDTDVMFLQMMVTSHAQGLALVRLVPPRAQREDLRMLAAAIAVTQEDEQQTMREWLRSWGKATEAAPEEHLHADHGGLPLLDPAQFAALAGTSGREFETDLLNLLIGHQHGAVELARMQTESGVNPRVRELARRIDVSRTAQIDQMLGMLARPQ